MNILVTCPVLDNRVRIQNINGTRINKGTLIGGTCHFEFAHHDHGSAVIGNDLVPGSIITGDDQDGIRIQGQIGIIAKGQAAVNKKGVIDGKVAIVKTQVTRVRNIPVTINIVIQVTGPGRGTVTPG